MHTDVGGSTFIEQVIERSKTVPVVVDFWAPWCGPCRTLGPVLDKLAIEAGGKWVLAKLNTDENQGLAQQYQIRGIPAVKAFVGGRVVDEFVGALPESQVRAWLSKVVPDEAAVLAKRALEAAGAGNAAAAASLADDALRIDPAQPDAILVAANAALSKGDRDMAELLLGRIRPGDRNARAGKLVALKFRLNAKPGSIERYSGDASVTNAYDAGVEHASRGAWREAAELFLEVVRLDRNFGSDAGRKALLDVFDAIGQDHPTADEFRRKLSMELFR